MTCARAADVYETQSQVSAMLAREEERKVLLGLTGARLRTLSYEHLLGRTTHSAQLVLLSFLLAANLVGVPI